MKQPTDIIRLTRAAWDDFKRQEAAERMELVRSVERGERTAEQANQDAFWYKGRIPSVSEVPLDLTGILSNADKLRLPKRANGRSKPKAICA
jgi:hypothetical protein